MRILDGPSFWARVQGRQGSPEPDVRGFIEDVRRRGDAALWEYTREYDGVSLESIIYEVPEAGTLRVKAPRLWDALEECREAIYRHHACQVRGIDLHAFENGSLTGRMYVPLRSVGVYVPGGTKGYPSTVLMTVIPAQVAGVKDIILTSPPGGSEPPVGLLCALAVMGVPRFYRVGGPWAIAALAYGTETVPRVDRIVGPGNRFVTAAKRLVYGDVDVDMLAGPSELMVLADEHANAEWVAMDLLSQLEHGSGSWATLVSTSRVLAEAVLRQIESTGDEAPGVSLVVVESLEEALRMVDEIAPEHLEVFTRDPLSILPGIRAAGAVYLGPYTPCALGDYAAGPSHVLPTGGSARFTSSLGVESFMRAASVACYTREGFLGRVRAAEEVAEAEGMRCHSQALRVRREGSDKA